jgi:CRP-like cAMP-binding protein
VAVPIVGLWASLSLYGVNKLEPETRASRQLARLRNEGLLIPGTADTLVRRWSNMLSQVDIFKELTDEERDQVATLGNVRMVQEGDSLGIEGQEGTSVYVILEGTAQLSANSSVGRITARVAGPGESLPLASILGEGKLITSIDARTDMRVWQVDSAKLRAFFSKNPEIAAKVYYGAATVLAERYRRTLWRLTEQSAGVVKSETFWANV